MSGRYDHYHQEEPARQLPAPTHQQAPVQKCKSCRAAIRYLVTANAKRAPVDADPVRGSYSERRTLYVLPRTSSPAGWPTVEDRATGQRMPAALVMTNAPPTVTGYVSHFATCPHQQGSAEPRKRGRAIHESPSPG